MGPEERDGAAYYHICHKICSENDGVVFLHGNPPLLHNIETAGWLAG
jgi:hypothetical protein